jgi:hypothetical protein
MNNKSIFFICIFFRIGGGGFIALSRAWCDVLVVFYRGFDYSRLIQLKSNCGWDVIIQCKKAHT